jgi:hypothetical protein
LIFAIRKNITQLFVLKKYFLKNLKFDIAEKYRKMNTNETFFEIIIIWLDWMFDEIT